VEELKRHGGVDRLRKALVWDDEEAVDIAASVIASCSGYTARGPGTRTQTFGEHSIAVHETDYVEGGLGWRVWASGVVMCRELIARHREIGLHGADVLEVGAGCGVVGFLAARLGARRVTFTDYLPGLLSNLDRSVELNAEACDGCELRVAHLEWLSAVPGLSEEARRPVGGDGSCSGGDASAFASIAAARRLPDDETFPVILGSDVCYEDPLPEALAHTLSKRLATPGVAWLTLPVRDWPGESGEAVIDRLVNFANNLGMAATVEKAPDLEEDEYEGGTFVRHRGGMVHVWLRRE
jgi:predicted nicotinamide N-methyase